MTVKEVSDQDCLLSYAVPDRSGDAYRRWVRGEITEKKYLKIKGAAVRRFVRSLKYSI